MKTRLISFFNSKFFDYFILVARVLLAITFIKYGYSKLVDNQFGLTEELLQKPIKELNLMEVGWYLFDKQPFKWFIGISQILCGILLLVNRTVLIGAILFLPIAVNILVIDLTIMPEAMANAFAKRLIFYILLDFLILFHYKKQVSGAVLSLTDSTKPKFKYKILLYLAIPVFAIFLEIFQIIPETIYMIFSNPHQVFDYFAKLFVSISKSF